MVFKSSPFKMVNAQKGIICFDADGIFTTDDVEIVKLLKRLQDVSEQSASVVKTKVSKEPAPVTAE